jgi:hypothetical protein
LRFNEERALWRDSAVLFHLQSEEERVLRAFRWPAELVFEGYLPKTRVFRYLAFGICSELGKDKTYFHRVERLPLPLELLQKKDLVDSLDTMLKLAQDISQQLWGAARTMATFVLAPQADNEAAHQPAREDLDRVMAPWGVERRYWGRLEAPFRLALEGLPADRDATLTTWQQTLRRTAWEVFDSVAREVETDPRALKAAVRGREQLGFGLAKVLPS